MSQSAIEHEPRTESLLAESGPGLRADETETVDPDELLSLLSDDHAREILKLVASEELPAREIADELDASRTTVYRRLDRLEDAGLVDTSMAFHPDGHHRQRFHASLDEVVLSFEDGGLIVDSAA